MISQGEVWWAALSDPSGSGPGFRRPIVVLQSDEITRGRIRTVICAPLTSNLGWERAPGNVRLNTEDTGLPADSIANVSLILSADKHSLVKRVSKISRRKLELMYDGLDLILGRK